MKAKCSHIIQEKWESQERCHLTFSYWKFPWYQQDLMKCFSAHEAALACGKLFPPIFWSVLVQAQLIWDVDSAPAESSRESLFGPWLLGVATLSHKHPPAASWETLVSEELEGVHWGIFLGLEHGSGGRWVGGCTQAHSRQDMLLLWYRHAPVPQDKLSFVRHNESCPVLCSYSGFPVTGSSCSFID